MMELLRNEEGKVILAVDDKKLYFLTSELEDDPLVPERQIINLMRNDEASSVKIGLIEKNEGRILTILKHQTEFQLLNNVDFMLEGLRAVNTRWRNIVEAIEEKFRILSGRIEIFEMDGYGMTSGWMDRLYLIPEDHEFRLSSCRLADFSISEIFEWYGLDDNEFWEYRLINGEFIEFEKGGIKSVHELRDFIIKALTREEQMGLSENKIPWIGVISEMEKHPKTAKLGQELKLLLR